MTTKINANNITLTSFATANLNVSAVYANSYYYANGTPFSGGGGGTSGPTISSIGYPGDDTAANTAGGQTITLTGSGFKTAPSIIINGTTANVVTFVNSTTVTFTAPAMSAGSYILYLVNTDGGTAIAVPGIQYSGTPTWSTAAGSLATYTETSAISNTVTATGDAPITYSLYSGSLPNGATLNTSSGLISGSSPLANNATTYNFTIRATDAQNQDTDRAFSITINPDVVTWSSPANNITYSVNKDAAISNVTLSATSASGQTIVYTANSLPTGLTLSGNTISGTPTVVASNNTLVTATANNTNKSAVQIINWVVSVAADTYFPRVGLLLSADAANTFVSDASTNALAITVNGDTKPNNFNPYTLGYYSNYFDGTGDYLSVADNAALDGFSGDFTIEFWVYYTTTSGTQATLSKGWDSGSNFSPYLFLISSGNLVLYASSSGSSWDLASGTTIISSISASTWYHIAISRSGSSLRIFANGSLVTTVTTSATFMDSSSACTIGSAGAGYSPMTGYVSNVRIVKGTAVYTSAFTSPTSPLTAITNTSLLTCQSNRFIDNSTNNFTITKNGDTTVSGFIPYTPSSSYSTYGSGYFDGTGDYLTTPTSTGFGFGTGTFTFEAWAYPTSNPTNGPGTIIDCRSGTNAEGWVVRIFNDLTVGLYDGPSNAYVYSTGTVKLNAWNHIAIVRSSTSSGGVAFYINGVAAGTATVSSNLGTTWVAMVGNNYTAGYAYYGYMTDVRVVKGSTVYTTAFTPPTSPLTAVSGTSLLTLQNNQPNNNSTFVDNSTNNFLVTRNGNATQGSFSPYAGAWSNYFDGTGDYLQIADNVNLRPGTGDFTYEFWWYPTSLTGIQEVIVKGAGLQIYSNGTGIYLALSASNSGSYYINNTFGTLSINTWYHIAVVRSGNTYYGFLNGTSTTLATSSSSPDTGTDVMLIGAYAGAQYPTSGYISNVRFVKGTAVYTGAFSPPTAPLTPVTNTQLLTCQSNRLIDNGINNFTITKGGDTSVQKFSPFSIQTATVPTSYSAYFDGSGDYLTTPVFGAGAGSGLFTTGATFTVEAWLYQTAYVNTSGYVNTIIGDLTPTVTTALWWAIGTDSTNAPVFRWYDGSVKTCTGTVALSTNTWNHVAFVCTSGTLSIYVNGTSQSVTGTTTISTPAGNQSSLVIGADRGYYVTGYISNLRVVKNVAAYTGNFTTPTSPLAATQSSGTNISAITGTQTALLTLQSTTFIDNSTNAFTITAYGDSKPTIQNPFGYTNPSSAAYTTSSLGGSMYFDGTGDYVTVANVPNLSSSQNWIVEAWVYPTNLTAGYTRFVGGSDFNLGQYTGTWYLTNNSVGLISAGSVTINTWYHIAIVNKAGVGCYWYTNGVLAGSTSALSFTMGNTKIGADSGGGSNWFGYISDFRVITNTNTLPYAANFVPPAAPLTAIKDTTVLVNGTSAGIYDSSMNNDFETVGNTQISTAVKKYGNASMYFDGTGDYLTTLTSPNLQLGTGDFTIECWSYLTSRVQSYPAIFSNYNSFTTGALALFAGHGSSTTTQYQLAINGTFPAINAGTIVYNTWVHLAVVRSGSTVTLYVGGTNVGTASSSADLNGVGSIFYIGTTGDSISTGCIQGYLSDFRVTKGYARYTGNFTPPTTAFIAK